MRTIIVTDANNVTSAALVREAVRLVDARPDLELTGFVTNRPAAFRTTALGEARRMLRRVLVAACDPTTATRLLRRQRYDLFALAHRHTVPVLVPEATINEPAFVARLLDDLRPDLLLSYYCVRILKAPLLDALPQAVNYHDGALPAYRGVAATSMSIYRAEATSGFTFHRMTPGIDEGPILVEGAVPIAGAALAAVERAKAAAAVAALPEVLDRVVAGDPGRAQVGPTGYHSGGDVHALMTVPDPGRLTFDEVQRRIHAFGTLRTTIDGRVWPVTRVAKRSRGRLRFRTADGHWACAERVAGLPARMARPA